jgi:hypothetical protein
MTPTTPDQGFAKAIADIGNIFCGLLNESEALTKERDELKSSNDSYITLANTAYAITDQCTSERDALMADAERYRFMKSCSRVAGLDIGGRHSWTCQIMRSDIKGATLDEAIDAALKKAGV